MSAQPLRVAVVGAGNMAREHVRAFASLEHVVIAGICSRTRAKAEQLAAEFGIESVCDSVAELFEATRADLAVVTVFETAMRGVAVECTRHPWALLLEKPPGMHLADARAIQTAVARAGRQAWVGLNRRFLHSSQTAATDLASHPGPRFIHVQDQQDQGVARALNHPAEVVDHWMFANSIHLVDYLRFFGRGRVTKITPVAGWDAASPSIVLARVDFDSGDVGLYEAIWNGPGPWAVTVSTSVRRWEMRPLEQAQFQNDGERKLHAVAPSDFDVRFKPGFRLQAEHVAAAVRGLPNSAPTLDEALETMALIDAVYRPLAGESRNRRAA